MMRGVAGPRLGLLLASFSSLFLAGCDAEQADTPAAPTEAERLRSETAARAEDAARQRATWYCTQPWTDPTATLLGDLLYRRFGVMECSGMGRRFLEDRTGLDPLVEPDRTVLSRLVSDAAVCGAEETAEIQLEWNRVVAPPLCCPEAPLSATWRSEAAQLLNDVGYGTTHVAIALAWARELGCEGGLEAPQVARLENDLAALIETPPATLDLLGEVIVGNVLVRGADAVPTETIATLLDAEGPSGWTDATEVGLADWHTNAVVCWGLLEWAGAQSGWLTAARSRLP